MVMYKNKLKYLPNVISSNKHVVHNSRITLVLHISNDYINADLQKTFSNWKGPISLAVYFPTNIHTVESICAFCQIKNMNFDSRYVSVHFIYPATKSNTFINGTFLNFSNSSCDSKIFLRNNCLGKKLTLEEKISKSVPYPINTVRNIARKLSKTKYIIISDVGLYFSSDFEVRTLRLARQTLRNASRKTLAIRIFEIKDKINKMPKNKAELLKLFRKRYAFEFHPYNKHGQHVERLDEWFAKPDKRKLTIQFIKKYDNKQWEPPLIMKRDNPSWHEETFLYPNRDNASLRWKMCRLNFQFMIVNSVFIYHQGLKKESEKINLRKIREEMKPQYVKILGSFNRKIDQLYPKTKTKCPKFF
uniref:N-acetyllactosaminide beta-1,3-N-acetylglucosaminyltransferase n=1 Tax=Rhabditophanes sp. KR3021 TaxID=114890 RepID=A0AC35TS80_9BILA